MPRLQLSAALLPNERAQPLIDGRISVEGIDLIQTHGLAGGEVFWRQLHGQEFDLAEMSVSDMLMLVSRGDDSWVMLPVFNTRRFFHTNVLVRAGAGIETPADLNGKRVGVQEFVQTANVWARGVLAEHHGLRPGTVHWHQERPREFSHSAHFGIDQPAANFSFLPPEATLGEMMMKGEVDAVFTYGGKRTMLDRSTADLRKAPGTRPLFRPAEAEALRYHRATGIFPMNHAPVIRRSIVERHPWVVLNLYAAFARAKKLAMDEALAHADSHATLGLIAPEARAALAQDPFPFGVKANRAALDTLLRYSAEQGLSSRPVTPEEVFASATLDF